MSSTHVKYLGPIPGEEVVELRRKLWWRKVPKLFLIVVAVPTFISAVYYGLIASPRYVSEARFVVRASSTQAPNAFGIALQGVGLATTQSDAFAVHEYIRSRDSLAELQRTLDVGSMYSYPSIDALSRLPRPWSGTSKEAFYKDFQRFVVVGYDSTNGVSTLRVEAFRPQDAQALANALLVGGEKLVNRLNERSAINGVSEAEATLADAEVSLQSAQAELTRFRNTERFVDPEVAVSEASKVLSELLIVRAQLQAEKGEVLSQAPQSPALPSLEARAAAIDAQIATERSRIAGGHDALVPKVGQYEILVGRRDLAARSVANASTAVASARQEERRQKLYLERVVNPNLPDEPTEPRRWVAILTVFATALLFYGVGWLIWAGVREHRQQ